MNRMTLWLIFLVASTSVGCGSAETIPEVTDEPIIEAVDESDPAASISSDSDGDPPTAAVEVVPAPPPDRDGDGIIDAEDNCPDIVNAAQANSDQRFAEEGYLTPQGSLAAADVVGDLCDDDRDGDGVRVTYLDREHGDDAWLGTYAEPVRTMARALIVAAQYGDEIHVAVGVYDVSGLVWPGGIVVRGAYVAGFGDRVPHRLSTMLTDATVLRSSDGATLRLEAAALSLFERVTITTATALGVATLVVVDGGTLHLREVTLLGDVSLTHLRGIAVTPGGVLTLERSAVLLEGPLLEQCQGLAIDQAVARIVNNVVSCQGALHSRGVSLRGGQPVLVHNTMRIGGTETASALEVSATDAVVGNNLLLTEGASDQMPLLCVDADSPKMSWHRNVVVASGGQGPQPSAIDCDGSFLFPAAMVDGASFGATELEEPMASITSDLDLVLDPDSYLLDASTIPESADAALSEQFDVSNDYFGAIRDAPFTLGAIQ